MDKKKVIIWDFDGPIIDSYDLSFELAQFEYYDVDDAVHRGLFNQNIFIELAKLKKKDISEAELKDFKENSYWPRKLEIAPVEGIKEILSELSQDFIMAINSSGFTPEIERYLKKQGLLPFFKRVYGREIERSKVKKFKLLMEEFGVSPKDCLWITDTVGDVIEANHMGITSIVVLWGFQDKKYFEGLKEPVTMVETPAELLKAIKQHFSNGN